MKAITVESFGGIEKLHIADLPKPKIAENEVLIKINYTSVNPVDWKLREGYLKDRIPTVFPFVPGWDAAGTIAEVGKAVKDFKVGDEVYAYCRKEKIHDGTYAEYINVEAANVAKKPKNIGFNEAASIPLVALTAWQALFDFGKLEKGQTILIHAGAGGVGSLAIQLAKYFGAKVITTASLGNTDYVKKLGADLVIDYNNEAFVDIIKKAYPKGIDLVFDLLGRECLHDSAKVLKKGGCLVSIVEPLTPEEADQFKIRGEYCFVQPNGKQLAEITKLIEQKKLKVPHIQEMRLSDAAKAQELSRQGHIRGKIVLKVS
jgi:NADPH2:quinone reductase